MSRIYDDQPLRNLPTISIDWSTNWNQDTPKKGNGAILEGRIRGRSKFAINTHSESKKFYYILHVEVDRAHRRKFDAGGNEIEPNFSETKKVSTGYLQSSYKVEPKGKTDKLSQEELTDIVLNSKLQTCTNKYTPTGCLSLWLREDMDHKLELSVGDTIRIKTDGDSPFIYSIAKMEHESATVANYTGGEQVGASWTDKIMTMKSQGQDTKEGDDDDDEWDD
ncbi:hypothetical protein ScPMuIL_013706 [Solemya velum]